MSVLLYRRPDFVAKLPGPMTKSQCQLYVDRTQKHKRSIPPGLSFENIVQNKALPPCSLQDFMVSLLFCFKPRVFLGLRRRQDYLTYISHDAENLQFYVWLKEYTRRFQMLPRSEQVLSPPWTYNSLSTCTTTERSSPPTTASSGNPSKKLSGVRVSDYGSVFDDLELCSMPLERSGDEHSFVSGTTRVDTPDHVNDANAKAGLKWQSCKW